MSEQQEAELFLVNIFFTEGQTLSCYMTKAERDRLTKEFAAHVNAGLNSNLKAGVYNVQMKNQQTKLAVAFALVRYIC